MSQSCPHQSQRRLSLFAIIVSLLALVATSAGVGYAAGQIGTNQIKNNAVTTAKVKNGTLTDKDMVKQEKQKVPTLGNGGEGDCVWTPGSAIAGGLGGPTYRIDRFGVVHLTGVAARTDGLGGDAVCDETDTDELEDGLVFNLPAKYRPAKSLILPVGSVGAVVVVGNVALTISPGNTIPPGSVFVQGSTMILDGLEYLPAGSKTVNSGARAHGNARHLLSALR